MDHIHNETVLAFLNMHKNKRIVKNFLKKQNRAVRRMNRESGTDYRDYLEYLKAHIGDDADFTMAELEALINSDR
jgi:hypothetical protein